MGVRALEGTSTAAWCFEAHSPWYSSGTGRLAPGVRPSRHANACYSCRLHLFSSKAKSQIIAKPAKCHIIDKKVVFPLDARLNTGS